MIIKIIINEHIDISQFFTHQNFPNPDLSKFSTVKILRHTVLKLCIIMYMHARIYVRNTRSNVIVHTFQFIIY